MAKGVPLGVIRDQDLLRQGNADRRAPLASWLAVITGNESPGAEAFARLSMPDRIASALVPAPRVILDEAAGLAEIARGFAESGSELIPVTAGGKLVGILRCSDLLGSLAATEARESDGRGALAETIARLDASFQRWKPETGPGSQPPDAPIPGTERRQVPSAAELRDLMANHQSEEVSHEKEERDRAAEETRQRVEEMLQSPVTEEEWQGFLDRAREAAERGDKESLLQFPSDLCTDGGRAINVVEPDWLETLRGKPAEIAARWESELKPKGFRLAARILDFPGGFPGDVGLFLGWGE
jgi:hypothetical protein